MYCIHCGAKLRDDAKFCTACGKPVKSAKPAAQPEKPAPAPKPEPRPVQAPAISAEIKENAIDFAKASAKQIISALKDQDIIASDQAGEIRCKADAAQSAFFKLLKKGLISLALLLSVSAGMSAQEWEMKKPIGNSLDYTATQGIASIKVHVTGGSISRTPYQDVSIPTDFSNVDKSSVLYQSNKNSAHHTIVFAGEIKEGDKITAHLEIISPIDVGAQGGSYTMYFNSSQGMSLGKKSYPITYGTPKPMDVEYTVTAADLDTPVELFISFKPKRAYGDEILIVVRYQGPRKVVHGSNETIETAADEESGENGWVVPAAVITVVGGGAIALRNRKKKKAAKKSSENKKEEKKEEKEDDDKDNDDEEKVSYEMRIRKDFGSTLTPGGPSQRVYARIVRITEDQKETTEPTLTGKIKIKGDSYLKVSGQGPSGGYMAASLQAPQTDNIPSEAVVKFILEGNGASFTNRMHFKIARPGIVFFQENITLPACSDEVWRLPFAVQGADGSTVVEPCSSCLDAYNVKVEAGEKEGLYYAVISEKAKDKKEPGTWELFHLGIKAIIGNTELSDSLPLYRFHMGLRFDPHSTIPCYLEENAAGRIEVAKACAELVYFDWDPQTNDIITVFPVPTDFKITTKGETEQRYLEKLGITCEVTSVTTDNGRQLSIYPVKGILDAPTRFYATISLTADCGKGRVETITKEVLIASQPVRQHFSAESLAEDKRIAEGLMTIQKSIWDHGEYNRLFPLYKLIDAMIDGYDGTYGFDKHQVDTVRSVYKRFLSGDFAGANATAKQVTLADEMEMYVESFLKTSEELENSMGFFTRMAVGVATLGMSDAVFTGLQVARNMKATAEKGGDTWDVFVAGVKVVAVDYLMEKGVEGGLKVMKDTAKIAAPKQYEAVVKGVENAKKKTSDFFSGITGKKTGNVLEKSKSVKSKAASKADEAIESFRKNPEFSGVDDKLNQVYKNGKAHGKAKVEDLQAAQWLMDSNPTPENIKLYKKKVLEVQRDKFAMQQLNNLPNGKATRAKFNKELDSVYKDVDDEVREILRKKGYDMDDKPFAATSSNKADLEAGNKVTYDRDVTYKTKDGLDVPQDVAQEAYEKAFYKRTTGIDAPSGEAAREWAQLHDQSIVQNGSPISYGDDLNPVIKDWDVKLSNAERTGNVMTYKSTEWFEQTNQMIRQANTLSDSGLRLDMLEQALSKRQEATRQMVKQFKYVDARDVAAQATGAAGKISEKMRFGMEISSRIFSTGPDALTLAEAEAILAKNNLTLELLSLQLGETLKVIG